MLDLNAYFARIDYHGSASPTLDTLHQLQRAHLYAVPFENLDIHIPRPIKLDEASLVEKIINEQRGGFCFEQNGFFARVLRQIGFDVTLLEANVYNAERDTFGLSLGHMTLMVQLEERYLVDVGFGSAFIEPLRLDDPQVQQQDVGQFRIEHDGERGFYYEKIGNSEQLSLAYRFFLQPHQMSDYEDACHYMQTSPQTHFTQKRICSKATPEGRITLSEDKFITTTLSGERHEETIADEAEFHAILLEKFGISVQTVPPGNQPSREEYDN